MAARYFLDETDISLARKLAATIPSVVYPGHLELLEVPRGALDDDWLPVIGRRALVVIAKDNRIRYRSAEKHLWIAFAVRGFVLTGKRSQSTQDSLNILQRWWHDIEATVSDRPVGPWMYSVTEERVREIRL